MQPGLLLLVQERWFVNDQHSWVDVVNPLSFTPDCIFDVRLSLRTPPRDGKMHDGVNTWLVNECDVLQGKPILSQWTEPLRLSPLHKKECESHLAMWAWMSGDFSFLPAYWHIHDVAAARAMLNISLNGACIEEAIRRRPI